MLETAGLLTAGAYVQHKASALVGQLPGLRTAEDGAPIFKVSMRLLAASVPGLGEPRAAERQQPFVEAKLSGVEKTSENAEYFEDSREGLLSDCPWRFSDTLTFTVKVPDIDVGSGSLKLRMRMRRRAVYGCCSFELAPGEVGIGSVDLRRRVLPSCVQENRDWADSEPRWTSPPMLLPLSHVRGGACGDHIQPWEPVGHLAAVFAVHSPPEVILRALKPSPASKVSSMVSSAMGGAASALSQRQASGVDAAAAAEKAEAMALSGQYQELEVAPEAPDLDMDGWECRKGPHGQTYWHHKAVGPAPWDAAERKVSKPQAGADLLRAAYKLVSK